MHDSERGTFCKNAPRFIEPPEPPVATSLETALLEVLDSVYTAADDKQVTVPVSLYLSAAFDTAHRSIAYVQREF